jgi:hypothetical protein
MTRMPPSCLAVVTRRLAAAGIRVHSRHQADGRELIILNVPGGPCCLTLTGDGRAQWHYEPCTSPAALADIIIHILGAPRAVGTSPSAGTYRALPAKGAVGRYLQGRGLTVCLQVAEDLESFEATTDIEITSPARPWLGLVRLSDNGYLEWDCDYRAAFHGDPSRIIDVITPVLRARAPGPLAC